MRLKKIINSILKSIWEFTLNSLLAWFVLGIGGISAIIFLLWDSIVEIATIDITIAPQYWKVYQIVVVILLLVALFYFIKYFICKIKKPKIYRFIEEGELAWKVNRSSGFVNFDPYCKKHKIKLISNKGGKRVVGYRSIDSNNYFCSECNAFVVQDIHKRVLDLSRQIVENKVEALFDNGKL